MCFGSKSLERERLEVYIFGHRLRFQSLQILHIPLSSHWLFVLQHWELCLICMSLGMCCINTLFHGIHYDGVIYKQCHHPGGYFHGR